MTLTAGIDAGTQSVKVARLRRPTHGARRVRKRAAGTHQRRRRQSRTTSRRLGGSGQRSASPASIQRLRREIKAARSLRTAAWLRAAGRRRRSAGPGQAVVRHQQQRRMRRDHGGGGRRGRAASRWPAIRSWPDTPLPSCRGRASTGPRPIAAWRRILLPHDYLNFWLTGEAFCEYGDASGTGWLDVRTRQWSPEMLRAIDPDRDLAQCLPPLVATDSTFPLRADRAERTGPAAEACWSRPAAATT